MVCVQWADVCYLFGQCGPGRFHSSRYCNCVVSSVYCALLLYCAVLDVCVCVYAVSPSEKVCVQWARMKSYMYSGHTGCVCSRRERGRGAVGAREDVYAKADLCVTPARVRALVIKATAVIG